MTSPKQLTPTIGLLSLIAIVFGNVVGTGIFTLPTAFAAIGSISLLAWLITFIGALSLSYVFSRVSARLLETSNPFIETRAAFGELVGFIITYCYWIAWVIGILAMIISIAGYLGAFWPILDDQSPHYNEHTALTCKLFLLWSLVALQLFGIKKVVLLQNITSILKMLPIILICAMGVFYIQPENYLPFNTTGHAPMMALSSASTIALWSFVGIESATIITRNARSKKHILIATFIGTLLPALLYFLSSSIIMGIVPIKILAHSNFPFVDAAKIIFSGHHVIMVTQLIALGTIISAYGASNGSILLLSELAKTAADQQLFPKKLMKNNQRGTAVPAILFAASIMTLLLIIIQHKSFLHQFIIILFISMYGFALAYFAVTLSHIKYLFSTLNSTIASKLTTCIAAVFSLWMLLSIGKEALYYGTLFLITSFPLYFLNRARS